MRKPFSFLRLNKLSAEDRKLIAAYFDDAYYRKQNPDLLPSADAVEHYLKKGWLNGLNPSQSFSSHYYLSNNPDVAAAGEIPFLHYLKFGMVEGRRCLPPGDFVKAENDAELIARHIDIDFYRTMFADPPEDKDLSDHFLTDGWRLGLDPNNWFSTMSYLLVNSDVAKSKTNPLLHFLRFGENEGRVPKPDSSALFESEKIIRNIAPAVDTLFYITNYDLARYRIDAVRHYAALGWRFGWDPSKAFSTNYYLGKYSDVAEADANPLSHYQLVGKFEGRRASSTDIPALIEPPAAIANYLDHSFYFAQRPDVARMQIDPVLHYLHSGWREGADPSPEFSTNFYQSITPELTKTGVCPLVHFLQIGMALGRLPRMPQEIKGEKSLNAINIRLASNLLKPFFDEDFYRSRYSDMSQEAAPVQHYLLFGETEGRDPAPWFSSSFYTKSYPDVVVMGINAFLHYILYGKQNGFAPFGPQGGYPVRKSAGSSITLDKDLVAALIPASDVSEIRSKPKKSDVGLNIHWIIPDFTRGGGGHMTIFRMVKWLEIFGHSCAIWVYGASANFTDTQRQESILRHYQIIKSRVATLPSGMFDFHEADAVVATSWDTAYVVRGASVSVSKKFYFVQDFEPHFYPVGARSNLAAATYRFGFGCICASKWIQQTLSERYGCWTRTFDLCADAVYDGSRRTEKLDLLKQKRIAFYSRSGTPRRAVELGLLALEILANDGVDFHVDFFGGDDVYESAPYSAVCWGIVSPETLSSIYQGADIGICFSATNYSLVPQEMMACRLPVVELDGDNTRAAFPDGVVALTGPDPRLIASTIANLLADDLARAQLVDRASAWLQTITWEKSARAVEAAFYERTGLRRKTEPMSTESIGACKASIVIPTYNGGVIFKDVIQAVRKQRAPWPFEIIVIDSESNDGTWEFLETIKDQRVVIRRINQREFQHGRTRNLGVAMAKGDFVAFLTQDAKPVDDFWLYNYVSILEQFPNAAGAFGSHVAWADASPFVKRDIENHFAGFENMPMITSIHDMVDIAGDAKIGFRKALHYYSDNNSCLRKAVWSLFPYPEIDYGEDQTWADVVTSHGFSKIYVRQCQVYHSHDYNEQETMARARIEARFFKRYFGYDVAPRNLSSDIRYIDAIDEVWAMRYGIDRAELGRRKRLNRSQLTGLALGVIEGESGG